MSENCEPDKTPGLISWTELTTHDAAASAKFYTSLFGWEREDKDMGDFTYSFFKTGERTVTGMIELPADAQLLPGMWINYVTVENLEAAIAKARELGAEICKDVTALPFGRFAIIKDPQGAVIGLWQFI